MLSLLYVVLSRPGHKLPYSRSLDFLIEDNFMSTFPSVFVVQLNLLLKNNLILNKIYF